MKIKIRYFKDNKFYSEEFDGVVYIKVDGKI